MAAKGVERGMIKMVKKKWRTKRGADWKFAGRKKMSLHAAGRKRVRIEKTGRPGRSRIE